MFCGNAQLNSGYVMPPAVRYADNSRHDGIGYFDRDLYRANARGDAGDFTISQCKVSSVVRMHMQRAAFFTLRKHMQIVHPGVV